MLWPMQHPEPYAVQEAERSKFKLAKGSDQVPDLASFHPKAASMSAWYLGGSQPSDSWGVLGSVVEVIAGDLRPFSQLCD